MIATTAVQFGNITAFALVTETMFQRPGLGLMFFRSIENEDMPVIAGLVMLAGVVFTAMGLIADVLLTIADPRTRKRTDLRGPL